MKKLEAILLFFVFFTVNMQAQMSYYGITAEGGSDNAGTIFKTDSLGANLQTIHSFGYNYPGESPMGRLVVSSSGIYYGVTRWGGSYKSNFSFGGMKGAGYIFSYNPANGNYTILHEFNITGGKFPNSGLLLINNKLYGTTREGGSGNKGVLFSYDISSGTYTVLHNFQYTSSNNDGDYPTGYLILASNGRIYGTTEEGGSNHYYGTIFSYNPANGTYAVEASFASGAGGNSPYGIMQAPDGNIYGINSQGANNGKGNIFRYNPSSHVLTPRANFSPGIGAWGHTPMVAVGNDSLYGIINSGNWSPSYFNIFLYRPSLNTLTVIDTLKVSSVNGFQLASNGKIYGAISYGSGVRGGIFEFNPSTGNVTRVFQHNDSLKGHYYQDPLILSNGNFVGLASDGGRGGEGIMYTFNPTSSTFTKIFDFKDPLPGTFPKSGLYRAPNGKVYGLTTAGGAYNKGLLFELNPATDSVHIKLYLNNTLGCNPQGAPMVASNGKMYFLTMSGGSSNKGTLVEVDTQTWVATVKLNLGGSLGDYSSSQPTEVNGKLYFATIDGTSSYDGAIVEYNLNTGTATAKYNFTDISNVGNGMRGNLFKASDGYLYFITEDDAYSYYSHGSISRFDPATGTVTFRKSLFSYTGYYSYANSFTEDANGKLWAPIYNGGSSSGGTIIEYDPVSNSISVKSNLTSTLGNKPYGGLLYASNGKLYGMTSLGGSNQYGTLFEYNTSQNAYAVKYNFDKVHGSHPAFGSMVEVSLMPIHIDSQIVANTLCEGDTAFLRIVASHNSRLSYQWYKNGVAISGATNDTLFLGALNSTQHNGNYTCKVMGSAADVISNSFTLSVQALPIITLSATDTSMCKNDQAVSINALPAGGTLSGYNLSGNTFTPDSAGNFPITYTYTNSNGCTNFDTLILTVHSLPNAGFSGLDANYCANDLPDTLTPVTAGGTFTNYAMSGNVFYPTNVLFGAGSASSPVTIIYTVTDANACTNADTMSAIVHKLPVVNFGNFDTAFCINDGTANLNSATPAGGNYFGKGVNGTLFDPAQAGAGIDTLIYTYTDTHNCTNSDTFYTMVYALPNVNFGSLDTSFCINDIPLILNNGTPSGGTYSGPGVQGIIFTASDAGLGTHHLVYTYTDMYNCTNSDTAVTTVYPAPEPKLPADTQICINHHITISTGLGPNYIYIWSDGSTNPDLNIDASTLGLGTHTFSVIVKDPNTDCTEHDTIKVIVNACTGIDNALQSFALDVFPNPSHGSFRIRSEKPIEQMEVYSSDGRLIWQENEINSRTTKLNLTDVPKGVYYLLIRSGEHISRKKLVIQ